MGRYRKWRSVKRMRKGKEGCALMFPRIWEGIETQGRGRNSEICKDVCVSVCMHL